MNEEHMLQFPPFFPSYEKYAQDIRLDVLDDASSDAEKVFKDARQLLKPCFLAKSFDIERFERSNGTSRVVIGGKTFVGKAISMLEGVKAVYCYIATCGDGFENYDFNGLDMLAPFWVDTLKTQALETAKSELFNIFRGKFHQRKVLSLNPGSGNAELWPIEQMIPLFELLGEVSSTGAAITESALIIPNKSISGLLFSSPINDYESCEHCEREHCNNRRAEFLMKM